MPKPCNPEPTRVYSADAMRLLPLKMSHHAAASGYDRLGDYLGTVGVPEVFARPRLRDGLGRLLRRGSKNSGALWYTKSSALMEADALADWLRHKNRVYHFLYGENCYRYLGAMTAIARRRHALVATYHTPPQRFSEVVVHSKHIRKLDAVVLMSNSQRPAFDGLIAPERLHFIPHGVDTEYFTPIAPKPKADSENDPVTFFCAGRMLRDYVTLAAAARDLAARLSPIRIVVVGRADVASLFAKSENVDCFSDITDEQLLTLYQQSHALVMPLVDCTANNVLLEGMACGLPVVATDLVGVRDYTSPACADLVEPANAEALAQSMHELAMDESRRQRMSLAAREQAMTLAWPKVAAQISALYGVLGAEITQ